MAPPGMLVEKVHKDQIPPGAKLLTEDEAFDEYWKLIDKKAPESLKWPFYWGIPALGAMSFITNHTLLLHYRNRLKMGKKGRLMMTLSIALLPSIVAPIGHLYYVAKDIVLQKSCPICLQTRSLGIQLGSAFAYSLTVTPLICFLQAETMGGINVPGYYTKEQRIKSLQLYLKFTKRASTKIYIAFLLNTIAATAVVGFEMKAFAKINEMILGIEEPKEPKEKLWTSFFK